MQFREIFLVVRKESKTRNNKERGENLLKS